MTAAALANGAFPQALEYDDTHNESIVHMSSPAVAAALALSETRAVPGKDLIAGYEKDVATVLGLLSPVTHDTSVEILSLPDRIRGYGPVKEKAVQDAKARYAQLAADLVNPPPAPRQIAAE